MWFATRDTQKSLERMSDQDDELNEKGGMPQYNDLLVLVNRSRDHEINKRYDELKNGVCLSVRECHHTRHFRICSTITQ